MHQTKPTRPFPTAAAIAVIAVTKLEREKRERGNTLSGFIIVKKQHLLAVSCHGNQSGFYSARAPLPDLGLPAILKCHIIATKSFVLHNFTFICVDLNAKRPNLVHQLRRELCLLNGGGGETVL